MKLAFYEPWKLVDHITDLTLRLKNNQEHLLLKKIRILDEDMTQFYVEQMLVGGMFEKLDLKEWEEKDLADKTFGDATDYFEEIISDNETYKSKPAARPRDLNSKVQRKSKMRTGQTQTQVTTCNNQWQLIATK